MSDRKGRPSQTIDSSPSSSGFTLSFWYTVPRILFRTTKLSSDTASTIFACCSDGKAVVVSNGITAEDSTGTASLCSLLENTTSESTTSVDDQGRITEMIKLHQSGENLNDSINSRLFGYHPSLFRCRHTASLGGSINPHV